MQPPSRSALTRVFDLSTAVLALRLCLPVGLLVVVSALAESGKDPDWVAAAAFPFNLVQGLLVAARGAVLAAGRGDSRLRPLATAWLLLQSLVLYRSFSMNELEIDGVLAATMLSQGAVVLWGFVIQRRFPGRLDGRDHR